MIWILHSNAEIIHSVQRDEIDIPDISGNPVKVFWQVCEKYPDELIGWMDVDLDIEVTSNWNEIFHHDLIMASFPVKSKYIPDEIGYIDQLPFINPDYSVRYPTWQMSTDVGGIAGKVALRFRDILYGIKDFGYLLNSIAKIGQQNSLFCYSVPELVKDTSFEKKVHSASTQELFEFVGQHYKRIRLFLLIFCLIRYENRFPLFSFFSSLFKKSYFKQEIDLSSLQVKTTSSSKDQKSIDVIIPTMGRPEHLHNVLKDLASQTLLPQKVIIVEQDPNENSNTKLDFIKTSEWPFLIIHHFIHKTGACNARNLAMKEVKSDYIFFADDDLRFSEDLLKRSLSEMERMNVDCLNLNCILPEGKTIFPRIKQWGAFGSGTSVVRSEFALKCEFSELLEHGFGEDIDFGMQLRSKGCDIIYHPDITTIHLKAPVGGFRSISKDKWKKEGIEPKPSPTMMILIKKYYNPYMGKGYKAELFFRFYAKQSVKNPWIYIKKMKERWQLSDKIASQLLTHGKQ
ncbi:glycosyltransferase [Gramella jeungdoensis]|uniref:Glycosyltransferase n=1 Tax=Gramella jeungdoensis TaxID=708091 RepID=A0ABT0Z0H6_9FLAO|nr:glycosyltransferase [Gramella jeungdoensis]MCM8569221.1 glycosyltransferase [Gramella jeungdoensis]